MVHILILLAKCKPGHSTEEFHYKEEVSFGKQAVYSYCNFPAPNLLYCTRPVLTNADRKY